MAWVAEGGDIEFRAWEMIAWQKFCEEEAGGDEFKSKKRSGNAPEIIVLINIFVCLFILPSTHISMFINIQLSTPTPSTDSPPAIASTHPPPTPPNAGSPRLVNLPPLFSAYRRAYVVSLIMI